MTNWKDSASAPNDDSYFLVYIPNGYDFYGKIRIAYRSYDGDFIHPAGDESAIVQPSHWMPLPREPSKEPVEESLEEKVERLYRYLNIRDNFIAEHGLWTTFLNEIKYAE